ncbi:DUF6193 family natural product biosynthesis protein [Streptomyces sp. NBC_00882]|uniref:DUF6193 family natural product biosynthesis protein n=1 Tax=Streptomyces TaxID=1883 RepID=UPI003870D3FC|nr:DUF6193 family natural product biosynthesis protein [Streptomyces sp. NBC_00882]WSZ63536.1 DUF6193 family natural product biosynthesis protein [Streptomyces canus]
MPEAPDIARAWRHLLERTPGTRQGDPLVIEAAHAAPQLRALHPFPTHATLHFLRSAPPWRKPGNLPLIAGSGPPHKVYPSGYAALLGEGTTAEEAAALVVAHLRPAPRAREVEATQPLGNYVNSARGHSVIVHNLGSASDSVVVLQLVTTGAGLPMAYSMTWSSWRWRASWTHV